MKISQRILGITAVCAAMLFFGCKSPTPTATGPGANTDDSENAGGPVGEGDMGGGIEKNRPDIRNGVIYGEFENIYFDYDSAVVRSSDRGVLEKVAQWTKDHPGKKIIIEGNCDERGTLEYNRALGQRRALAARAYLVKLGVSADRLGTVSYGEEQPEDPGHNEDAWAKNRRDVFGVVK